jgi:site-specific recombinase XerD
LLIKWSRLAGELDSDPSEWIPFVDAVEEAPRDVTPDEQSRLEAAAQALEESGSLLGMRDSLIFHLMLDAGLRISETVELKLSDLGDLENGKMHVLGKGMKHRRPHVKSALANRIRTWLDRMPVSMEETLITDERGMAIGRHTAWKRFKRIAEAAGVTCTPHTMRHTFVMNYMAAYMRGDPSRFPAALKAASQETGDNEVVLLKYYTGPRESDMRAAVEAM